MGPCIRGVNRTPTNKHGNFLANFTPLEAPMVPPLLTVCIQEIEKRGLNEVGLYRIPGNESETNDILDKLTHAKGKINEKLFIFRFHYNLTIFCQKIQNSDFAVFEIFPEFFFDFYFPDFV